MARQLSRKQLIERSLLKKFRTKLWAPFMTAISKYDLLSPGDRICVCLSGGKDSMLLAKLMQELQRHSRVPFQTVYLVMDPGYNTENRKRLEENAALLGVPIVIRESFIFEAANRAEQSPCYLCARMRRGFLYHAAQELSCNKIALGHHLDDVIETTLMGMLYSAKIEGMLPKLRSQNFPGMELIRPLYRIREADIIAWASYHELTFLQCACRFTEKSETGEASSKRRAVKELIRELEKRDPGVTESLFQSLHAVHIETLPAHKYHGMLHSFLEHYDDGPEGWLFR